MNKYISVLRADMGDGVSLILDIDKVKTKRQALDASIEKWETMVKLLEVRVPLPIDEGGADSCGLCTLYYSVENGDCRKCSMYKRTGFIECRDTPYRDFVEEKNGMCRPDVMLKHAKRELAFLQSLKSDKVTRDR